MNNDLEKIDDLIKEALSQEEAKFYDDLEEQNLFGKIGEVYKGKLGWLAIIMNIVHLIVVVLLVYCIVAFFKAEEVKELIKWASGGFLCMIMGAMIKLYIWMQMDKNDILRELKRLELQLAVLANKDTARAD